MNEFDNNDEVSEPCRDDMFSSLAFSLGRAAHKFTDKVDKSITVLEKGIVKAKDSFSEGFNESPEDDTHIKIRRIEPKLDPQEAQLSYMLKELKAISDISGLTKALEEMNELSLQHSSDPIVNRLISSVTKLTPYDQEELANKFMMRLGANPYFSNAIAGASFGGIEMTEEDSKKMSDAFVECVSYTLEDVGMIQKEQLHLQKLTDDIAKPINDLMQFYTKPKTFGQKAKRLWKMQRIFVKTIKLMRRANKFVPTTSSEFVKS